MADDDTEANDKAALARLRMFLAPHAPLKGSDHVAPVHVEDVEPITAPAAHTSDNSTDADTGEASEELTEDLSTLAEQLSAVADEEIAPVQAAIIDGEVTPECPVSTELETTTPSNFSVVHEDDDDTKLEQPPLPAVGAVATVTTIPTTSKEFTRVKYLLQYSLAGFRVHDDLLIWDMKNPELMVQYEAYASGILELDSWVEVDNLSAAMGGIQPSHGFTQVTGDHHKAMKFTTGNLPMDPCVTKKGRKQLVLCKIAVGRSLLIHNDDEAKTKPLPSGYQSYHIGKPSTLAADYDDGRCLDNGFDQSARYRHEYILNDALQILPQYLVRFSYSALEVKATHACALCEKNPATLVCKSCDAELCTICDQEVHSANKLVERHKRTPKQVRGGSHGGGGDGGGASGRTRRRSSTPRATTAAGGDAAAIESSQVTGSDIVLDDEIDSSVAKQIEESMADFHTTCHLHVGKKIEFFCPVCAVPVCVNCKMVGDHSIGDKGSHRLLSLTDAYERSLRESFKSDPLVESRKSVIGNKLALIAKSKSDIQRNRERVEAAIKQQYEQAMSHLDEQVETKMSVLDGEALEFERQQQHMEWLEDCLYDQRASCSVIDFLATWNHHKALRAQQRDFPPTQYAPLSGDHVKADLQLVGHLQVVSGDQFERSKSSFTSKHDAVDLCQDDKHVSPRGSIGSAGSATVSSVRRTSDSEIRRKLLSMRAMEPQATHNTTEKSAPSSSSSSTATLSAQGMKMIEDFRKDLLTRGTIRSPMKPAANDLDRAAPLHKINTAAATLRTFSIQPSRSISTSKMLSGSDRQRTGTQAWTALLRHELGLPNDKRDN